MIHPILRSVLAILALTSSIAASTHSPGFENIPVVPSPNKGTAAATYLVKALRGPNSDAVVTAFKHIRHEFEHEHAKYGMEPIRLPSCFSPEDTSEVISNDTNHCLTNLGRVIKEPALIKDKWMVMSIKDYVHAVIAFPKYPHVDIMKMMLYGAVKSTWHFKFAEKHSKQILDVVLDNGWTKKARWLFARLLAHVLEIQGIAKDDIHDTIFARLHPDVAAAVKLIEKDDQMLGSKLKNTFLTNKATQMKHDVVKMIEADLVQG